MSPATNTPSEPEESSTQCKNRWKYLSQQGYADVSKIADTMQGCVVSARDTSSDLKVVAKVTERALHDQGIAVIDGVEYPVEEDILMERNLMRYLSRKEGFPDSIVKYLNFFKSQKNYYLVQEFGGKYTLRDFTNRAHQMIAVGQMEIAEWRRTVKIIFNQMVEAIEFLHQHNVVHFDVSLENFMISETQILIKNNKHGIPKLTFVDESIKIKLCDFGLARVFTAESNFRCSRFVGKATYWSPEIANRVMFNAKSNDIWCLGVCLFMLSLGGHPFLTADESDFSFRLIVNGGMMKFLLISKMDHFVTSEVVQCMQLLLQYEHSRIDLHQLRQIGWL